MIIVTDKNNIFIDDFIERLKKYLQIKVLHYDQLFSDKKSILSGEVLYLTPSTYSQEIFEGLSFLSNTTINNKEFQQLFINKNLTGKLLQKLDISYPDSIFAYDLKNVENFISKHQKIIVKKIDGCGGAGHVLVENDLAFFGKKNYQIKWCNERQDKQVIVNDDELKIFLPCYLQKFLYPDNNSVWRAYVVGGKLKFWSVRKRDKITHPTDLIINIARGAEYDLDVEPNEALLCLASKIINKIGCFLDVAVVDFICHNGQPYVLEMDCDGLFTMIDREFYEVSTFDPNRHDLDRFIAEWIKERRKQ